MAAPLRGVRQFTLMFPGQGAQVPGMALDLAEQFRDARLVIEEASEALSMNIGKLLGESSVVSLFRGDKPAQHPAQNRPQATHESQ